MKITKQRLREIIKEELSTLFKEGAPELSFEGGRVILKTGGDEWGPGKEWGMSVEEFLNMKAADWDPDVVEIETMDMAGKSIDIPKEMWLAAAKKLKGA